MRRSAASMDSSSPRFIRSSISDFTSLIYGLPREWKGKQIWYTHRETWKETIGFESNLEDKTVLVRQREKDE